MSRFGPEKVPGFVYYFFMKLFCNSLLEDPSSILHHCRHHCHGQHHKAEGDAVDADTITPEDLKFYNSSLEYIWEPGLFNIYVGTNSRDVKSAQVTWNK